MIKEVLRILMIKRIYWILGVLVKEGTIIKVKVKIKIRMEIKEKII